MKKNHTNDDKFLLLSVIGAVIFSIIGLIWGIIANSQMILFDGIYSVFSVILSFMTFSAAKYIRKKDQKKFPYGKVMIEPFVILIKYVMIALIVMVAGALAVMDIVNGGRIVALNSAIIYSIFSTLSCFLFVFYIKIKNKKQMNGFVKAEMNQWLMDGYLSLGVFIGFLTAVFLTDTQYSFIVPYIDPFMVLIASILFLKVPLFHIIQSIREMIGMAPPTEVLREVQMIVKNSERKYKIKDSIIKVTKAGSGMYIDIDFIVNEQSKACHVKSQDVIREDLMNDLRRIHRDPMLVVSFTTNRKWAL
ncbi:cation transporter [Bacillus shivajii]|uniref:cation diffusion facilitator family transporter n=1 Tax=Bacillus shivajii TaxID=1983719 RepID=UPI001CF9E7BF|nr:cation transporter [Bacillus shivajii]UCZ55139.1 cation transporter [Bacillus shivajii]